jgi:proteasome-associated ATPase
MDTFTLPVHSTEGLPPYGPPGCGKTLIGRAAAASLKAGGGVRPGRARYGYEGGQAAGDSRAFSRQGARDSEHVVGESERMVGISSPGPRSSGEGRCRIHCEAESILGTRRRLVHSTSPAPWYRCSVPRWMGSSRCAMW